MGDTDLKSKKFILIVLLMCFFFTLLVMRAYTYLPDSTGNEHQNITINIPTDNASTDKKDMQTKKQEGEKGSIKFEDDIPIGGDIPEIDEINESSDAIDQEANKIIDPEKSNQLREAYEKANDLKDQKQYNQAVSEYQRISDMSENPHVKANCYEEIATIYGITQKYSSALTYAQKSYKTFPTTSRELLLARLYYKSGNIDKSTKYINDILQRDIKLDN